MKVYGFMEWIIENHPECLEEGPMNAVRKWGRAAALGGSLAAGAMGCSGGKCDTNMPNSSVTSPDAGDYLPQDGADYTSPDAGSYMPNGNAAQAPRTGSLSAYEKVFGPKKQQAAALRRKGQILRQQGKTNGTFIQGQPQ